jgi:hypothetical protein
LTESEGSLFEVKKQTKNNKGSFPVLAVSLVYSTLLTTKLHPQKQFLPKTKIYKKAPKKNMDMKSTKECQRGGLLDKGVMSRNSN